jgi:hypothetical protein
MICYEPKLYFLGQGSSIHSKGGKPVHANARSLVRATALESLFDKS